MHSNQTVAVGAKVECQTRTSEDVLSSGQFLVQSMRAFYHCAMRIVVMDAGKD